MSFILDALRKSENERRLEAAPDIIRGPIAVRRDRVPTWAIFLLGSLSAALISLSVFVVLDRGDTPSRTQSSDATRPVPAATIIAPAATATSPATTSTAGPETASGSMPQRVPEPVAAAQPVSVETPAAATPPVPAPAVAAAEQQSLNIGRLPAYASAVSEGLSIGVLQMQLHVHSSTPANRFVVINGRRYREGETLTEGPVVETIVAEGAVLRVRGSQYLLTAN